MKELDNLKIEEVSLVDAGANPEADIVLYKRGQAEAEEYLASLNKRLEARLNKLEEEELLKVASKYELLGEKKEDLAKILKSVKGTAVYDKILSNLERELTLVEKSGVFEERGKSGRGSDASIDELTKRFMVEDKSLTSRQARAKAYEYERSLA